MAKKSIVDKNKKTLALIKGMYDIRSELGKKMLDSSVDNEELFKVILLILVMSLVYYFSKNRKLSIVLAVIMTMIVFGAAHEGAYGTLLQVLLIQGLGSIFDLYAYMKTKNVFVSYIAHLLFDFTPYFLEIIMILGGW